MKLPGELSEGAEILGEFLRNGVVDQVAERLRVRRRAGSYIGLDAVLLLLLAFTRTVWLGGVRGFCDAYKPLFVPLGALAGRSSIMSSTALSSLLAAVDVTNVVAFAPWFLVDASGIKDLLRDEKLLPIDASGRPWQVFWYDPTREAYRQRRLSEGADAPHARRRAARIARPGHRGRKRGEVVATYGLVQHVTGAWVGATLVEGNGAPREQFESALSAVIDTRERVEAHRERIVMVCDGEFGDVPYLDAAQHAGVALVTRCSRYNLLESAIVRRFLASADWRPVPSGGTGTHRLACDLGVVALPAGESTRRSDGSRYDPVQVRIVVTRRADSGSKVGSLLGGERLELFVASDVPADAWPAEDVVALYFARSAQENSFSHVDQELHVDATVSYELGGQLLAAVCALFVWNRRLGQGAGLHGPLAHVRGALPTPPSAPLPPLDVGQIEDTPPRKPSPKPASPDLAAELVAADIAPLVAARGWTWLADACEVVDASGERFAFAHVVLSRKESAVRFHSVTGRRTRQLAVSRLLATRLKRATAAARSTPAKDRRPHVHAASWPITQLPPRAPNLASPTWSMFSGRAARRAAIVAFRARSFRLIGRIATPTPTITHPLFHQSAACRRHARLTWNEQQVRSAAPPDTHVTLREYQPKTGLSSLRALSAW